jgi:hypothetical protein
MVRRLLAVSCWCGLLAAGEAPAQQLGTIRFDNWLYFQSNTDGSERWQYRPRVYIPFSLSGGWTFTQRVDLPVYYTDKVGPDNPTGEWKTGIGDWTRSRTSGSCRSTRCSSSASRRPWRSASAARTAWSRTIRNTGTSSRAG